MVGHVAVYLLSGLDAERVVVAGHEAVFIHKGDVPEGHVADDVMLYHFHLVLPVMDDGGKWQGAILTDGHHCPREIYVMEIVLHNMDVLEPVLFRITSTRALVLRAGGIETVGGGELNILRVTVIPLVEGHAVAVGNHGLAGCAEQVVGAKLDIPVSYLARYAKIDLP